MRNQKQNSSPVRQILKNHGLGGDIPPEIRSEVSASMGKNYRNIIKKAGGLTLTASLTGILFFLLKRVETWLPAAKVTVPVAVLSLATTATIVTHQLTTPQVEPVLLLSSFKSASLSDSTVQKTGNRLMEKLNAMEGRVRIALHDTAGTKASLPLVVGSMEQMGKNIYLTVKVIDPVTSKILYIGEAAAEGEKGLESASDKLAAQLHNFASARSKKKAAQ